LLSDDSARYLPRAWNCEQEEKKGRRKKRGEEGRGDCITVIRRIPCFRAFSKWRRQNPPLKRGGAKRGGEKEGKGGEEPPSGPDLPLVGTVIILYALTINRGGGRGGEEKGKREGKKGREGEKKSKLLPRLKCRFIRKLLPAPRIAR